MLCGFVVVWPTDCVAFLIARSFIFLPWESIFLHFNLSLSFFQQPFLPLVCLVLAPLEFRASQLSWGPFVPNCAPSSLYCMAHLKYCFHTFTLLFAKVDCCFFYWINKSMHERRVELSTNNEKNIYSVQATINLCFVCLPFSSTVWLLHVHDALVICLWGRALSEARTAAYEPSSRQNRWIRDA